MFVNDEGLLVVDDQEMFVVGDHLVQLNATMKSRWLMFN